MNAVQRNIGYFISLSLKNGKINLLKNTMFEKTINRFVKQAKYILDKYFVLVLFIVTFVSYGQMLGMNAWKDDNAIFFKFDHVYEQAGFFGVGVLGTGPYKFSITPYLPIYKIFGNTSFVPYYSLILIFYFFSTLCVYLLFSKLFSKSLGRIAALLFAAGNISSEGFYWLANAMLANVSIILITLIIYFYYCLINKKGIYNYFIALFLYWVSAYIVPLRSHYFIVIIVVYEIIFHLFRKLPKSILTGIVSLLPFFGIFYFYFLATPDNRALSVSNYFLSLLRGDLYNTYNLISSISNLFIPDNYFEIIYKISQSLNGFVGTELPWIELMILAMTSVLFFNLFKKLKYKKILTTASILYTVVWLYLIRVIYNSPLLSVSGYKYLILFSGGIIIYLLVVLIFLIGKEKRKLFAYLVIFIFISIGTYCAYAPTEFFGTHHRYFTNAFVAVCGILGLVYLYALKRKDGFGKILSYLIILWGILNIANSVIHQNYLLRTRSIPVFKFYRQLREYLPKINIGDVIYFDINPNALKYYDSAFSVSSMPETTAIAWRYGVDRYDFEMYTSYDELLSILSTNPSKISSLYTFYYDKDGLVDTTEMSRKLMTFGEDRKSNDNLKGTPLLTSILLRFEAEIIPDTKSISEIVAKNMQEDFEGNMNYKRQLMSFLSARDDYFKNVKIKSQSEWKYQELYNIIDQNVESSWRGHRIRWSEQRREQLVIDLGEIKNVNRLIWTNKNRLLTPTAYTVKGSVNNQDWHDLLQVDKGQARKEGEVVIENFAATNLRFISFDITGTLSDDSPAISEIEVVESRFSNIEFKDINEFLLNPFHGLTKTEDVYEILSNIIPHSKFTVSWKSDEGSFSQKGILKMGLFRKNSYEIVLSSGGLNISNYEISIDNLPVLFSTRVLSVRNLSLKEMEKYNLIKVFKSN